VKQLLPLFFIVVVDLLGFGIIIPLFPFMGVRMGLTPAEITLTLGAYSACQLIAAPFWGALSDRYGRRPILMTSMLGASTSYFMLAFGDSIVWLVASRVVGGFMAGNISAAMAYAADVTPPENRAKGLGMIGAAVGLGFMMGPALGGLLAGADAATANYAAPALTAAGLSLLAALSVWGLLRESHTAEHRAQRPPQRRGNLRLVFNRPALALLIVGTLLFTTAHAMLESIVALWALGKFGFGPRQVGLLLLMMGAVLVVMHGAVIGRLTRRFGEKRVAIGGVIAYVVGLGMLAFTESLASTIVGGVFCGIGAGAYNPSVSSLVSKLAAPHERGVVMGTYQSASSLARVIGPAVSGALYAAVASDAPFVLGMLILLPVLWFILRSQREVVLAEETQRT
jgi:DHA1 family tetracycline resistance protein-like MFS transporter